MLASAVERILRLAFLAGYRAACSRDQWWAAETTAREEARVYARRAASNIRKPTQVLHLGLMRSRTLHTPHGTFQIFTRCNAGSGRSTRDPAAVTCAECLARMAKNARSAS